MITINCIGKRDLVAAIAIAVKTKIDCVITFNNNKVIEFYYDCGVDIKTRELKYDFVYSVCYDIISYEELNNIIKKAFNIANKL